MLRDCSWGSQCSAAVTASVLPQEKGRDSSCCAQLQHTAQPARELPAAARLSQTKPFSQGCTQGPGRLVQQLRLRYCHRVDGAPAPPQLRVGSCQITPVLTAVKAAGVPAVPALLTERCVMQNSSLLSEHTIVYEGFTWNHTNPGQLHTLPLACSIHPSAAGRKGHRAGELGSSTNPAPSLLHAAVSSHLMKQVRAPWLQYEVLRL